MLPLFLTAYRSILTLQKFHEYQVISLCKRGHFTNPTRTLQSASLYAPKAQDSNLINSFKKPASHKTISFNTLTMSFSKCFWRNIYTWIAVHYLKYPIVPHWLEDSCYLWIPCLQKHRGIHLERRSQCSGSLCGRCDWSSAYNLPGSIPKIVGQRWRTWALDLSRSKGLRSNKRHGIMLKRHPCIGQPISILSVTKKSKNLSWPVKEKNAFCVATLPGMLGSQLATIDQISKINGLYWESIKRIMVT